MDTGNTGEFHETWNFGGADSYGSHKENDGRGATEFEECSSDRARSSPDVVEALDCNVGRQD